MLLADAGGLFDSVNGASGSDLLSGGSGNDLLIVATDDGSRVQMLGGSGRDLFRVMSLDDGLGDDGRVRPANEQSPLSLDAFIADLTAGDGIDLSALRSSPIATTGPTALTASGSVSGDLGFLFGANSPNSGLQVVGLTVKPGSDLPVFDGTGRRDPVTGQLKVALASQSDVNAAIQRGSDSSPSSLFGQEAGFDSINTLLVDMSPIYQMI
jgi:hypothetical protein